MTQSLPESAVVRQLAEEVAQRVARRVIRKLKRNSKDRLSGEDSGLRNIWEEVCVQIQGEHSVDWSAYELTIEMMVALEVEALVSFEREAVWLQTDQSFEWDREEHMEDGGIPFNSDDVVQYIVSVISREAMEWSNSRIRLYQEMSFQD